MPRQRTSSSHSVGRKQTAAPRGQGRGVRAPAAARAATLDGAQPSGGYPRDGRKDPRVDIDFARIRRLVPLTAVLARYGLLKHLKRAGSQLRGCCPIHEGSNARQFIVNLKDNSWHCFGDCKQGGGTLEFVAHYERVSVPRAAALIAKWFALEPSARAAYRGTTGPGASARSKVMTANSRPSHRAYMVENREGGSDDEQGGFWTRIGSAWPHKDGKGLNIVLSALPINGRIVLREYTAEDEQREQKKASKGSK